MDKSKSSRRRTLNSEQLAVLKLLYKFRYGSNDLFAQFFNKKDRSFVFKRLKILLEQGYIDKRFESSYRLRARPAAYFLTSSGARKLADKKINMATIYRNVKSSDEFVDKCLDIFAIRNQLKAIYSDSISFFTRTDLNQEDFSYFPQPLPDAYISLRIEKHEQLFFLDIISQDAPFFAIKKRIKQYIDYDEVGEWDDTGTTFPTILIVCPSETVQRKLLMHLQKTETPLLFMLTTLNEIKKVSQNDVIWLVNDTPEKISLSLIS